MVQLTYGHWELSRVNMERCIVPARLESRTFGRLSTPLKNA
jgi:hypothetical protein